jgi:hypothetical protein
MTRVVAHCLPSPYPKTSAFLRQSSSSCRQLTLVMFSYATVLLEEETGIELLRNAVEREMLQGQFK